MHFKLGWIKNKFFPIHRHESLKFILLSCICLLICMNYNILRNLKETLIITNPDMGIYVIPFLRTWMLMPIMLIFVKAYASMSARYRQNKVFYCLIAAFTIYFFLFIYVLLPNETFFRLDRLANSISPLYPSMTKPISEMIRHWSFSLYYCLSEVWGTVVVLILFWGTSNRLNTIEQAKRFYAPMIFITNFAGIFSAQISLFVSNGAFKWTLFPHLDSWKATLSTLTLFVCLATLLVIYLFYKLHQKSEIVRFEEPVSKEGMNLMEILRMIRANRKFWPLAVMVFAYFFSTGILELIWKHYLLQTCTDSREFNDILNTATSYIGLFSTLIALFATGDLIRRFDWRVSALVTPILLMIPLAILLINSFFETSHAECLRVGSIAGAAYYCVNRICKFTFFDLSKEIATVEFSYAEQIKAKAVLDGIFPKVAKTGESLFLQFMFILFSGFGSAIIPILIVVAAIHLIWAVSIPKRLKLGYLKKSA